MADEYTPTTDEVREVWAEAQDITHDEGVDYHRAELDRWLAAHDESVRAAERERIARDIEADRSEVPWNEDSHPDGIGCWIDSRDATKAVRIVREGAGA